MHLKSGPVGNFLVVWKVSSKYFQVLAIPNSPLASVLLNDENLSRVFEIRASSASTVLRVGSFLKRT